jgi:hypothetical protein
MIVADWFMDDGVAPASLLLAPVVDDGDVL